MVEPRKSGLAFRIDGRSGVATYVQIVQQVKHAVRLGSLVAGDQLPTVKEVASQIAVNPNTVAKAYRELEREGIVRARPGVGTFVNAGLTRPFDPSRHSALRRTLERWVGDARGAGLDDESLHALWDDVVRSRAAEDIA